MECYSEFSWFDYQNSREKSRTASNNSGGGGGAGSCCSTGNGQKQSALKPQGRKSLNRPMEKTSIGSSGGNRLKSEHQTPTIWDAVKELSVLKRTVGHRDKLTKNESDSMNLRPQLDHKNFPCLTNKVKQETSVEDRKELPAVPQEQSGGQPQRSPAGLMYDLVQATQRLYLDQVIYFHIYI